MKTQPTPPSDREVLAGLVERVTYQNAQNGFCVIRVKARGHRDLITVVGHAAIISAGEWVTASGDWVNDRTHGQQFKARFLKTSAPNSVEGIEKYLASGMIRGIGPVYAKKLLRAFGEKVFDVIEVEPDRLREVDGIGPVRASRIVAAWAEQKVVREIMVFLHSHGVGTARAVRIYKTYGTDAVQIMSENPYRLARDIRGIGVIPDLRKPDIESDFYFVEANDPETAVPRIVELVKTRIPGRFGLDPIRDVQVLCPMNRNRPIALSITHNSRSLKAVAPFGKVESEESLVIHC